MSEGHARSSTAKYAENKDEGRNRSQHHHHITNSTGIIRLSKNNIFSV